MSGLAVTLCQRCRGRQFWSGGCPVALPYECIQTPVLWVELCCSLPAKIEHKKYHKKLNSSVLQVSLVYCLKKELKWTPSALKTDLVVQMFWSYQLPWSCHRICAKLQPEITEACLNWKKPQTNPSAFWRDADFRCVWVLTTYIMSAFSNKSVICWPQNRATDASYRKTAATKWDV